MDYEGKDEEVVELGYEHVELCWKSNDGGFVG